MNGTPIEILNTVLNLIGVTGLICMLTIVWGYKQRVKDRYEGINKRLDHILLLTSEAYQSEIKEKRKEDTNAQMEKP